MELALFGGKPAVDENIKFKIWPEVTSEDEKYVLDALRQPYHGFRRNCATLQYEFAKWNGNSHCLAVNSGTAALHIGIAACGVGAGDEVITTALSWTSSGTAILHHNGIPIFVDIDIETMLIDPQKIEAAITEKTKAILPVHYWGLPCDMDPIIMIAKKYGLYIIEDACQAYGSLYKGRKVGTFGNCAAFSLNESKNLSAGEGGLFVSDDPELTKKARAVMNFGEMTPIDETRDYHSHGMGWMYRMNELTAAYARSGLARIDETNQVALENWRLLHSGIKKIPGIIAPFESEDMIPNGYTYVFRVDLNYFGWEGDPKSLRDIFIKALTAEGVPVNHATWALPLHTVFQAKNGYGNQCPWSCPQARKGIDYSMEQYPNTQLAVNTSIQLNVNSHRPPNGKTEIFAFIAACEKVFTHADRLIETIGSSYNLEGRHP